MATGISAGRTFIEVRPDLRGWGRSVKEQLVKEWGRTKLPAPEIPAPDTEKSGRESGEKFAGAFDKAFRTKISAALKSLPDVKLNADSTAAERKMQHLRSELEALNKQRIGFDIDTSQARTRLAAIQAEMKQLSERAVKVDVQANALAASTQLASVERIADGLDGKNVEIDVKANGLGRVNNLAGQTSLTLGQMAIGAATLGSALIPLTAAVGGLAAALAAPLAVAGGGATVYGLLAGFAVKQTNVQLKVIAQAKEKLDGLKKGTKEYNEALGIYRRSLKDLTPEQRAFMKAQQGMSASLQKVIKQAGPALLGPLTQGMNLISHVMLRLKPLINSVGGAFSDFLGYIGTFTRGPAFKSFIQGFADLAGPTLTKFGLITINVFRGLFGVLKEFAPIGFGFLDWLHQASIDFRHFGENADKNKGLQNLIGYIRDVGPVVISTLKSIGGAVVNLVKAFAPIGTVVLKALGQFANLIANMPTGVLRAGIIGLTAAVVAYKVATLAAGAATAVMSKGLLGMASVRFGALGAGVALLASGLGSLDKNASSGQQALAGLKNTAGAAAAGFAVGGPWGAAIGGATGLLYTLTKASYNATDGFRSMFHGISRIADAAGGKDKEGGLSTAIRGFGAATQVVTNKLFGSSDAADEAAGKIKKFSQRTGTSVHSVDELTDSLKKQTGALTRNTKQVILKDFADHGGLRAARLAGINIGVVTKALYGNEKAYFRVSRALNDTTGKTNTQRKAGDKLKGLLNTSNREVTEAQQKQRALSRARAQAKKPLDDLSTKTQTLTKKNRGLADAVKGVPANPTISWRSNGFEAVMAEADRLFHSIMDPLQELGLFTGKKPPAPNNAQPHGKGYASGGLVLGAGTGTSDSIPALLSNREFVVNAAATRRNLGLLHAMNRNRFAAGGEVGRISHIASGGGFSALWRREIKPLLDRLIHALRASGGSTFTPPTHSGGGGGREFLNGRNPFGGGNQFLGGKHPFAKPGFLQHSVPKPDFLSKTFKQVRRDTAGMESAVGKGTKKVGKYWEVLRKSGLNPLQKRWREVHRDGVIDANMLDKGVAKNTRQIGNSFLQFRSGPLKGFDQDWGQTFRKDTPNDLGVFRSKALDQFGKTRDGIRNTWGNQIKPVLKDFGAYPKQDVAPAFGKGVDAIGKQWQKIPAKTGPTIRDVVNVQLNHGLLAAFNKIAKFVDTKTIDNIDLPKFRTGGKVFGPGTPTSDSVLARLSTDEHVLTAAEVKGLGGHRQVEKLRELARGRNIGGDLGDFPGGLPGFRSGGKVGKPGVWDAFARGLEFAKRMAGLPGQHYQLGGVGPVGADCSGYMGTIANYISNRLPPYFRIGTSASAPGWQGFRPGPGLFSVGYTSQYPGSSMGHVAGTLMGTNVESSGDEGPHVGGSRGAVDPGFSGIMHMGPHVPLSTLGGGQLPLLPPWAAKIMANTTKWASGLLDANLSGGFGNVTQSLLNTLVKPSAAWATDKLSMFGGGSTGVAAGAAQKYAKSRLKAFGWGGDQFGPLQSLWDHESGWNYQADNPTSSAYGIPQGLVDLHNIPKPYWGRRIGPAHYSGGDPGTQVDWGLRYIKGAHGSPAAAWSHWQGANSYDQGGEATGMGLLPKLIRKPERVLNPSNTETFDQMLPLMEHLVAASRKIRATEFQPFGNHVAFPDKLPIVIDDWERGKGFIDGRSAMQDAHHHRQSRSVGALY